MLSRLIREVLFNLIHIFLNILDVIQYLFRAVLLKIKDFYSDSSPENDLKLVLEYSPHVRKKLKHLVLMSNNHNQTLNNLARLVIWSLVSGVSYVSVYDRTGELLKQEEKLFLAVERLKKGVPGYITWSNKSNLNGYSNGLQANKITVNIFTSNDGHSKIIRCIKQIALRQISSDLGHSELTVDELDKEISQVYPQIPDPDLVLYTGPVCSTNGLLPWHIRLTEFIQISVDNHITVHNYVNALSKFSKCDQRFGK